MLLRRLGTKVAPYTLSIGALALTVGTLAHPAVGSREAAGNPSAIVCAGVDARVYAGEQTSLTPPESIDRVST